MYTKSLVQAGYKNKVLYLQHFQIDRQFYNFVASLHLKYMVTPLFQIKMFQPKNNKKFFGPLDFQKCFKRNKMRRETNLSIKNKRFDIILWLYSNIDGNARKHVLLNSRRSVLIEFLNKNSIGNRAYSIALGKINSFVPQQQLLTHLNSIFRENKLGINKSKDDKLQLQNQSNLQPQNQYNLLPQNQSNKKKIQTLEENIFEILFPFDLVKWSNYLKKRLNLRVDQSIKHQMIQKDVIQIQIYNAYIIQFSRNRQFFYEDVKDLSKMLTKFNFVRYFNQIQISQTHSKKNCQRLIKGILWSTQQTEQYLLFLIRNQPWERFQIYINNFIELFQRKFCQKKMQNKEPNMQTS